MGKEMGVERGGTKRLRDKKAQKEGEKKEKKDSGCKKKSRGG